MVLLILIAGDAINLKTVCAILMPNQTDAEAWILTAAMTLSSIALMHAAGSSARLARRNPASLAAAAMLGVVWAGLGAAAFWIRLTQQLPSADLSDALDLQGSTGPSSAPAQLGPALVFVALYAASGTLAAWFAYRKSPGVMAAGRAQWRTRRMRTQSIRDVRLEHRLLTRTAVYANRRRRRARLRELPATLLSWWSRRVQRKRMRATHGDLKVARQRHGHAEAAVAALEQELQHVVSERRDRRDLIAHQATEMKREARVVQALLLGDPAATSALTSTTLPAAVTYADHTDTGGTPR
ncbi:hypothetical protein [Winogradskya consettensis]|uniref:hypothetical protein n=1 Tax=Winogradskya consettensis TaxID=113560 RepID=UPI001BB2F4D1|nr:hypothetical protein [Actinoplanes consettensis]